MTLVTPAAALAGAALAGLLLAAAFEPALRRELPFALTGLVLALLAAAAPNLFVLALVALAAVLVHARLRPGGLPAPAPALGCALLAAAGYSAEGGSPNAGRLAALTCALAIAAFAGVLPLLASAEPGDDRPGASGRAWSAFLAPPLVLAIFARSLPVIPAVDMRIFANMLMALGSLNVVWGLATSIARSGSAAWRATLLVDWGFVLVGLGLLSHDGTAAAYLLLLTLLLLRLPLLLWGGGPASRLSLLGLGGSPPFAGFPARLLLLRAAMVVYWPFAVALAVAMVVGVPASLKLREEGAGSRRLLAGQAVALAVSAAIGLYPAGLLRPVGLG